MKLLLTLFALIAVGQAAPRYHWYETTETPDPGCPLAKDAKFLEGVVRGELMIVKLVEPYHLRQFLINVSKEMEGAVNGALRLFQLTSTHEGIKEKVETSIDERSPMRHLFKAVDALNEINGTHAEHILGEAHYRFQSLYYDLRYHYSSGYIKRRIINILEGALRRCNHIVENGCKEEPTEEPTPDPWGTTWRPRPTYNPWETTWRPRPTYDPWETTWRPRPTYDPWETTWRPRPTYDPWETTWRPRPTYDPWETTWRPRETTWRPRPWETTWRPRPTENPWGPTENPTEQRGTTWYRRGKK